MVLILVGGEANVVVIPALEYQSGTESESDLIEI